MSTASVPRRTGPDACPGAVQVHAAADGGLARIRIPGGGLWTEQFAVLRAAAVDLGDGQLELTSRGNIQLRGLRPGAEGELAERLRGGGLLPAVSHETVRNVVASPMSGLDDRGLLDVRPLVAELDRGLLADPDLAGLPGRFLFALDDGRGDVCTLRADVTVRAVGRDLLALRLAGAAECLRVATVDAVPALLAAAHAFLAERAATGTAAWRLDELPDGPQRVAARVRVHIGAATAVEPAATAAGAAVEPAATAAGAAVEPAPAAAGAAVEPATAHTGPVGLLRQRDCLYAIGALAPLGRLDPNQAELLSQVVDHGTGQLVVTPWRSVVLPHLLERIARRWLDRLAAAGLPVDPTTPWLGVTACAGRPGCAKSLADVRADAFRVVEDHGGSRGLPVHWIGCSRGCGRPAGGHVDVLATGSGYQVGGPGGPSVTTRTADETAAAIATARSAAHV